MNVVRHRDLVGVFSPGGHVRNGICGWRLRGGVIGCVLALALGPAAVASGASWKQVRVPPPAAGNDNSFSSVSCATAEMCVAVGSLSRDANQGGTPTEVWSRVLVEQWNGLAWKIDHVPLPAHVGDTELTAVSCPTPTMCVAVGGYSAGNGGTLIERWNGHGWSAATLGSRWTGGSLLSTVSCPSSRECFASGVTSSVDAEGDEGVILVNERWNGHSWSEVSDQRLRPG